MKRKILPKNPYAKLSILFFILILAIGIIYFSLNFLINLCVYENQHFIVQGINIKSSGRWAEKKSDILDIINIEKGKTVLLGYNTKEARLSLEDIPSIDSASVTKSFPNTLNIEITEKIPCAFVGNIKSEILVDDEGMILSRQNCIELDKSIPFITGYTTKYFTPGEKVAELKTVVEVISELKRNYIELHLVRADISEKGKIKLYIKVHRKGYTVEMPSRRVSYMLKIIYSSLVKARDLNMKKRHSSLMFRGEVVWK